MIDFQNCPRQSGKTSELISLCKIIPGIMFVPRAQEAFAISQKHNLTCKSYSDDFSRVAFGLNRVYYFDEFFAQKKITYKDLIHLDSMGIDVTVRGTLIEYTKEYKEFMEWHKNKYPEYNI